MYQRVLLKMNPKTFGVTTIGEVDAKWYGEMGPIAAVDSPNRLHYSLLQVGTVVLGCGTCTRVVLGWYWGRLADQAALLAAPGAPLWLYMYATRLSSARIRYQTK